MATLSRRDARLDVARRRVASAFLVLAVTFCLSACGSSAERRVTVALIDTGVATRLGSFSAYEIQQADAGPSAEHGTMMLSTVLGLAGPDDERLPSDRLRVLSYDVGTSASAATLATAIEGAVTSGAEVISVSMGVRRSDPHLKSAVARAADRDALVVAAAGNVRFLNADYPARYSDVLSVAALEADGSYWAGAATKDVSAAAFGVDVGSSLQTAVAHVRPVPQLPPHRSLTTRLPLSSGAT